MKKIDELLSTIPKDKASIDFTASVMDRVFSLAEEEISKEISLEKLLSTQSPQKVSMNFSDEVMKNISTPQLEKPLINKWGWAAITVSMITLLFLPIFNSPPNNIQTINIDFGRIPIIYPLSVFALGALIFIDYFFRSRKTI
jgi:uncharacterized integral membrane protein